MITMLFGSSNAADLKVGDPAPLFKVQTHEGKEFDLQSRKGHWTILYFYPKAETPGCTKQACAFRDNLDKIKKLGGEVFGISTDTVEAQAKFHAKQKLNFTLLADPDGKVTAMFGNKMPIVKVSKRWTYIIDPELRIRVIDKNVDPVMDALNMAKQIETLKAEK